MATVPADGLIASPSREITYSIAPALAIAAFTSIGAGAIHAAAIGVHSEHRQAVITFTIVAALQIGWGALALMTRGRWVAFLGIAINGAAIAGFLLAKSNGISFIDGLDVAERVQYADGIAAALAAVCVLAAVYALLRADVSSTFGLTAMGIGALATAIVTITGMVAAGSHSHAEGHSHGAAETSASGDGHTHGDTGGTGGNASGGNDGGHSHVAAVVPPKKYDPTKPIDLSGVEGVTPEQQARAENLIAITLARLPKFADYRVAEAAGYKSIGDGFTGDEHFVNQAMFDDGRVLDPDYPESLVYDTTGGGRKLAAAMFMLGSGTTLDDVPDVGGKLTQWHIHNNLCFTTDGKVAGITSEGGTCNAPLVKGPEMPMIHVWIQSHPCGPFAALEGVGGGQIKAGEERLCDTAHGSGGS
jgi:hypothetical protein